MTSVTENNSTSDCIFSIEIFTTTYFAAVLSYLLLFIYLPLFLQLRSPLSSCSPLITSVSVLNEIKNSNKLCNNSNNNFGGTIKS